MNKTPATPRDTLFVHFDTALESPDGIKKLRELILTLAMQGKLVKQDPKDQPASELLKEIKAEKERLIKEGKIKRGSRGGAEHAEIRPEEVPYEVPEGWVPIRLGEIGFWKSGSTPSRTNHKYYDGTIPWVKSGEVKQGRISSTEEYITEEALKNCSLSLNDKGSVLVAMYGANIGEVGILDIPATTNQAVCACKTYKQFDESYLLHLITSLKPYFLSKGAGAAQPNISREKIIATPILLPPLAEQKRIVAKIDELMALCDKLEAQRNARKEKILAVHRAAINQLLEPSQSSSPATSASPRENSSFSSLESETASQVPSQSSLLRDSASPRENSPSDFLFTHFDPLYSVKENVAELKKAILTLAMQGKLVKQDPKDQPASQLLKEIQAEKERLIKEGKIKKGSRGGAERAEIKPEEVPYEVPEGWVPIRLGEIGFWKSGSTPSRTNHKYYDGTIPWVKSGEVKQGRISSTEEYITEEALKNCSLSLNDKGSVLVAMYGANIGEVGILDIPATTNQAVCACKTYKQFDECYLLHLITSLKPYFLSKGAGAAQPNISREKIIATPILLPPLTEQKRIVAKIDELMALCDKLEKQIDQATAKQTALFDAVLAKV